MSSSSEVYISELEAEKARLEAKVLEFQAEIRTINNLILRRKSELTAHQRDETINQKNVDRLFFETLILDAIQQSKRGLRTAEIYDKITESGYGLNYNTLRSYVTKMRDKGFIKKSSPSSYHWISVEKKEDPLPAKP